MIVVTLVDTVVVKKASNSMQTRRFTDERARHHLSSDHHFCSEGGTRTRDTTIMSRVL
jgi:hypothetical protein